jgi:fructokinase
MSDERIIGTPLCVGIGELLWDLLPSGKALGGAPINVAAHAVQLGLRGAAISAVGADEDGREIRRRLQGMGLDLSGLQEHPQLPTGLVSVRLDQAGSPDFTIHAPSAWDDIRMDDALERLAQAADAVVFGSLGQRDARSHATIVRFLSRVRPGCLKVFDINLRRPFFSKDSIIASLDVADVLKMNETELPILSDMLEVSGDETAQLRAIRKRFDLDLIIYTRGAAGSRLVTEHVDISHPGCPTTVVDAVGAGDAFTATVTAGLVRGQDPVRIQESANRVAAFVCSQAGAVPRLPQALIGDCNTPLGTDPAHTSSGEHA